MDCNNTENRGRSRKRKPGSGSGIVAKIIAVLLFVAAAGMFGTAVHLYFNPNAENVSGISGKADSSIMSEVSDFIGNIIDGIRTGGNDSARTAHQDDNTDGQDSSALNQTNVSGTDKTSDDDGNSRDDSNGNISSSGNAQNASGSDNDNASADNTGSTDKSDPEAERLARLEELTADGSYLVIPGWESYRDGTALADTVTLLFAGDILFDSHYSIMASMLQRSGGSAPDISTAFDETLLQTMRSADIFMINNEFPYSDRGAPLKNKSFTFRAAPAYASLLNDIGVDIAALANNHVNDYGPDAMSDTFATLKNAGIPYVGAGADIEEASKPLYYTNGDIRIAFIAATQIERMPGPDTVGATDSTGGTFRCYSDAELERLISCVREAKEQGCFTVVYIHWGTESTKSIDQWQLKQGELIADAGADVIVGNHPHVLQRLDYIGTDKNVPVIYSLGNYLFNSRAVDTCLYQISIDAHDGSLEEIRFIPAVQKNCRTAAADAADSARILKHMRDLSPTVAIDEFGVVTPKY